jgi:hypothetical protein
MLRFALAAIFLPVLAFSVAMQAQQKPHRPASLARLEVSSEIATTTQQGQPAVMRITLKNICDVAVDLPMPSVNCSSEDGTLSVEILWHSDDPDDQTSSGRGCGGSLTDRPSLMDRVRNGWIHLLPGEFLTVSENLHQYIAGMKPGTIEYWTIYAPPRIKPKDLADLQAGGYIVPEEELSTDHRTFSIR